MAGARTKATLRRATGMAAGAPGAREAGPRRSPGGNGAPAASTATTPARPDDRVKAARREQIAANQAAIANLRARLARQPDARALAESEGWDRFLALAGFLG